MQRSELYKQHYW